MKQNGRSALSFVYVLCVVSVLRYLFNKLAVVYK